MGLFDIKQGKGYKSKFPMMKLTRETHPIVSFIISPDASKDYTQIEYWEHTIPDDEKIGRDWGTAICLSENNLPCPLCEKNKAHGEVANKDRPFPFRKLGLVHVWNWGYGGRTGKGKISLSAKIGRLEIAKILPSLQESVDLIFEQNSELSAMQWRCKLLKTGNGRFGTKYTAMFLDVLDEPVLDFGKDDNELVNEIDLFPLTEVIKEGMKTREEILAMLEPSAGGSGPLLKTKKVTAEEVEEAEVTDENELEPGEIEIKEEESNENETEEEDSVEEEIKELVDQIYPLLSMVYPKGRRKGQSIAESLNKDFKSNLKNVGQFYIAKVTRGMIGLEDYKIHAKTIFTALKQDRESVEAIVEDYLNSPGEEKEKTTPKKINGKMSQEERESLIGKIEDYFEDNDEDFPDADSCYNKIDEIVGKKDLDECTDKELRKLETSLL